MSDSNVVIHEYRTFDSALEEAQKEGAATMTPIVPGVLYRQANRFMVSTSLPLRFLVEHVKLDSVKKGEDPTNKRNRPLMSDHVNSIGQYLKTTQDYILPPITLNVGSQLLCFTTESKTPTRSVCLLMPPGFTCYVTDGQHRIAAIDQILEECPWLAKDAVAVNLVFEADIDQIHQDFADCAQTKPIPSSLLAAFNSRNPIFMLLKHVSEDVPFFKGRIDKTSKSIGKTSLQLFTLNQIRFCVAEILLGNSVVASDELSKSVAERLEGEDGKYFEEGIVFFYKTFTWYNSFWKDVAAAKGAAAPVDIPGHRADYVDFTATGLQVISRVGHAIMFQEQRSREDQEALIQKLADLDYRRTASIWQGNIIEGGNLKTNNVPVKKAVAAVKEAIGLMPRTNDTELEFEEGED